MTFYVDGKRKEMESRPFVSLTFSANWCKWWVILWKIDSAFGIFWAWIVTAWIFTFTTLATIFIVCLWNTIWTTQNIALLLLLLTQFVTWWFTVSLKTWQWNAYSKFYMKLKIELERIDELRCQYRVVMVVLVAVDVDIDPHNLVPNRSSKNKQNIWV